MSLNLIHARYVITAHGDGFTIYSEDARGQWDATGLNPNGPFATLDEAANHLRTLPNAQNQVEVINRIPVALMLGAQPDQPARWWSTTGEALRPELRHVDAYAVAKASITPEARVLAEDTFARIERSSR